MSPVLYQVDIHGRIVNCHLANMKHASQYQDRPVRLENGEWIFNKFRAKNTLQVHSHLLRMEKTNEDDEDTVLDIELEVLGNIDNDMILKNEVKGILDNMTAQISFDFYKNDWSEEENNI